MDLKEFYRLLKFREMLFSIDRYQEQDEKGQQLLAYQGEITLQVRNIFF